ncbi:sorting nexin-7-like [Ischnura elegans]|uniref:sorting nexin-7-like n=1 Tax=Ischnura elegans TaxID=197161 RepID=UPI001ED89116|nr:sorting nexin-7-like [Ischnura elegans]
MADDGETAVLEVSTEIKPAPLLSQNSGENDSISRWSNSVEGSVVASPSIESFSTLPEQEVSEFGLDTRDLQVRVDNPQKHLNTLETFITFRITTRTSRAEYEETEYVVRRRYNDFVWLRQKLVEDFPTHLIPPLPEKHSLLGQLDRYSRDFVYARMALLHRFLNRVADHPVLSCHHSVRSFLTAKPSEFSIIRKTKRQDGSGGGGFLGRFSDSIHNIANVYLARERAPPEFERVSEYVASLGDKLANVDKVGARIHKERLEHLNGLQQLHPILSLWSASEAEPDTSHCEAGSKVGGLGVAISAVAAAVEKAAKAERSATAAHSTLVARPLREYLLYIEAVREALARRDAVQASYEAYVDELKRKRTERVALQQQVGDLSGDLGETQGGCAPPGRTGAPFQLGSGLWKSAGEAREEKLRRLSTTIPELVQQVEDYQDKMECANENLRADLERWHLEKKDDLKQLFIGLAKQQIQLYQEFLNAWEEALPIIKVGPASASGDGGSGLESTSAEFVDPPSQISS